MFNISKKKFDTKANVWGAGMAQWRKHSPTLVSICELCLIIIINIIVEGYVPYCKRFFSRYSAFPLSSKSNISNFQFNPKSEGQRFVGN